MTTYKTRSDIEKEINGLQRDLRARGRNLHEPRSQNDLALAFYQVYFNGRGFLEFDGETRVEYQVMNTSKGLPTANFVFIRPRLLITPGMNGNCSIDLHDPNDDKANLSIGNYNDTLIRVDLSSSWLYVFSLKRGRELPETDEQERFSWRGLNPKTFTLRNGKKARSAINDFFPAGWDIKSELKIETESPIYHVVYR